MVIVIFHAFYIFGKYIYENFYNSYNKKTEDDDDPAIIPENQLLSVSESDYRDLEETKDDNDDKQSTNNIVKVKFFPPAYVQRYNTVQNVLTSAEYHGKIHKVIDFGCAELSFALRLKNTEGIKEIYCIDIDRSLIDNCQTKIAPLHCDYISPRPEPLTIHVCEGSIAHNDNKLTNTDAVVCIELIEHLYPDDLDAFPYNVFGFIKPQVAIVTTPNADFNVLFRLNGFRHDDHKFEWTRPQFQDWANNIILRYPDYEVTFHGIAAGPDGTEHLGSCSQMAVFHRHTQLYDERPEGVDGLLKTVVSYKYPYKVDNRSDEEKMLAEAEYYIRLFSARDEDMSEEIPLKDIMFSVQKFRISIDILKSVLENANWVIAERENGPVVLIPPQSTFSSDYEQDFGDFLDNDYRHHDDGDDWDDLEPGASPSGHFFNSYMERDAENHEEDGNWDDEIQDTRHSSSLNLNNENLSNSELHVSENLDRTSDSQWTMEDLNDEVPLLDTWQHETPVTTHSLDTETELPSNSFLIGLNSADINYLDVSNDELDASEHHLLSSPLPLNDLTENSHSLRTDISRNLKSRSTISKNQVENYNNHSTLDKEKVITEFQACYNNQPESEHDTNDLPSNNRSISPSQNSLSLHSKPEGIHDVDCNPTSDEMSSTFTSEATFSLSEEQSLLVEGKDLLLNDRELLRNEEFPNNSEKRLKPSIDTAVRGGADTSLLTTDQSVSENDYNLCSINLGPSATSDNSFYKNNDISHLSIEDFSSTTNESYKNLDASFDSIDSNYKNCQTDLFNVKKNEYDLIKNQDSMSFKSISGCSLDIKPKYTSSPQIETDIHEINTRNDKGKEEFLHKESSGNHKFSSMLQTVPQTLQNLQIKDTDCRDTHQSNITKKGTREASEIQDFNPKVVETISPSESQLSLKSNSDVSLSTVTSTGSSNVEKWYAAETNPMYQRDLVVLKGGNDSADNPNEETTSDSDAMLSVCSERERDKEINKTLPTEDSEEMKLDITDEKMNVIQDKSKNLDEDIIMVEIFPEQTQNGDRSAKQIENEDIPTFDILGSRSSERSQLQLAMSNCKSISIKESSTSYNPSKINKEKIHSKYEFDTVKGLENFESKGYSQESLDTPPNSWSPEIMDSGYPNSASVHDLTPEYELSSIANDRISDSDSSSIGEAPVQGFYEFIEVENGDLANNNRDDEGNNVIAFQPEDDLDDLQPLIDVLENDMENENDIYVLQNGFPLWLLRILEMANPIDLEGIGGQQAQQYPAIQEQAGGDAPNLNAENDEGFDSSSSDDDTDIEDDGVDDATTGSSDETEDHSAEDLATDWRAGGDP